MGYDLEKSQAGNVHRHRDDWDEVHQQMIEVQEQNRVQKKSLAVSDPGDADEKEADQVARKVVAGEKTTVLSTGQGVMRQKATPDKIQRVDVKYKSLDKDRIQAAAKTIIGSDAHVKEMIMFFGQIKKRDGDAELEKFLTGERKPALIITDTISGQGETPPDATDVKSKIINVNSILSYPVAVSTYLHELNHYLNIWYTSEAAGSDKKENVESVGVIRGLRFGMPSEGNQASALGEGLNARIEMIISEVVQTDEPAYPHPQTLKRRQDYKDWLAKDFDQWLKAKETTPSWQKKKQEDKDKLIDAEKQKKINKIRKELQKEAKGGYKNWGFAPDKDGKLVSEGTELGFAFEKNAYGFDKKDGKKKKKGEWAVDFNKNFEEKYKGIVDWYEV